MLCSRMQAAYAASSSHSANGECVGLQSAHVNSPTSYSCMLSGTQTTDTATIHDSHSALKHYTLLYNSRPNDYEPIYASISISLINKLWCESTTNPPCCDLAKFITFSVAKWQHRTARRADCW